MRDIATSKYSILYHYKVKSCRAPEKMAVPEIIERLDVFTETGALIAELLNINTSTKLSGIRNLLLGAEKIEELVGSNFVFLKKHAPISNKQEESVALCRVVENGKDAKAKFLYLRSTDKLTCKDGSAVPCPYSAEEIQLSEGIEREKRTYWNKRIQDFARDLHEQRRTKHEVYGIIDVEWVHKKSDLLKVMYDKAIRFLGEKDMELSLSQSQTSLKANTKSKFVCREMELAKNYEELCKAEFELKTCYQKIEDIHAKKKDFDVSNKGEKTKWSRKLEELEMAFDKHFTKSKQQQAALLKCLQVVDKAKSMTLSNEMPCTDLTTADVDETIDEEDVEKIANDIKNDYFVEEMSESD